MSSTHLLRQLGYLPNLPNPTIPAPLPFEIDDIQISSGTNGQYTIAHGTDTWQLHTKVVLDDTNLRNAATLAVRFAPPSSTVSLQPDTHVAGNIFVGMVMSYDHHKIPVHMISGDIGCGLTVIPVCSASNHHSGTSYTEVDYSRVLATMRSSLKRGKLAEDGLSLNEFTNEAMGFYDCDELDQWLAEMEYVLKACGIRYTGSVLEYIGRYAQSLGSSGNHFMEMAEDEWGKLWLVVHSGSRGLGAKVYDAIAGACRYVTSGFEVATGPLAVFYVRAYEALNRFAKLNRVISAIAVLKSLGLTYTAPELREMMRTSTLFAPAIDRCSKPAAVLALIGGLTHNGIKAFVNHSEQTVLFVLCKGSVAMTKRASASIVALRAGEGCYVWTMVDSDCPWQEMSVAEAVHLGYRIVYEADGVVFSGHGAGRSQGTGVTARESTFEDVMAFYLEEGIVGNIAPGILGDNPRKAYKDVTKIMAELPLHLACTKSQLRTKVSYKEGLSYKKREIEQCADYIKKVWDTVPENRRQWLDVRLCQRYMGDESKDQS